MLLIKSIFRACFTRDKPVEANETVPAPFQRLPLELIHEITANLPPSSELALRHTNRWFYANAGPEPNLVISDLVRKSLEYQLEYLGFLERDARSPRRRFACSVCVQLHPHDEFSVIELQKGPASRTCQRAWICEHRTLSLAEYRNVLKAPVGDDRVVRYPYPQESAVERTTHWHRCCTNVWTDRCFGCLGLNDDRTRTLATRWAIPLSNMIAFGDALTRGIENESAEMNFYICPHVKPKDRLADLLACNIESQLTKNPVRHLRCKDCNARFWCCFGNGYFEISCYRFLGYGRANDPSWSSQLPL